LTDADSVPRSAATTRPDAKLTGPDQESQHWIDTALACDYISEDEADAWIAKTESIGRLLGSMMAKYESFCR